MSEMKTITINGVTYTVSDPDSVSMGENGNWWVDGKDTGIPVRGAGRLEDNGGVVFGDERNQAPGQYAIASGARQQHETDTPYPKDDEGNEIIPESAWRYNEAIGTGSIAAGMGNVAFSRASKAFGFRTQTGSPPARSWTIKRPEMKSLTKTIDITPSIPEEGLIISVNYEHHETSNVNGVTFTGNVGAGRLFMYLYYGYVYTSEVDVVFSVLNSSGETLLTETHVIGRKEGNVYGWDSLDFNLDMPAGATQIKIVAVPVKGKASYVKFESVPAFLYAAENVGQAAVAIGADTVALDNHAFAGGWRAVARGKNSIAFGSAANYSETPTEASGYGAVAIGHRAKASGSRAIAMGMDVSSSGKASAAFGNGNQSVAEGSFATGVGNKAGSYASMAGGNGSETSHVNSVAIGRALKTGKGNQAVFGQFNSTDSDALLVIGKGTTESTRGNAFVVKSNGNILVNGKSVHTGADYAEFFEWIDGNPDDEDRIGLAVALEGEKIRFAMPGDEVLGIVSGTAAVLGDAAAMHWKDKYLTDEFGRLICDMVEDFVEYEESIEYEDFVEYMDPETGKIARESIGTVIEYTGKMVKECIGVTPQPRLNPEYDPESIYIPREERKEWDQIGMMGKLYVRDDGTLAAGDYGCPGENGILTKSDSKTNIRVMKRTSDNIVLVLLK